jgi:hypothetical protein
MIRPKKKLDYVYVLKNGVNRYNVFFLFLHKAETPDSEFIGESVCACAKLIVDEEAHGTLNRIVELNKTLTDYIRKRHKKEDSALVLHIIDNT